MAVFKCKMCGGGLEINSESGVAVCEYCGSVQTLPKRNDEVIANLFNRANNLRIKCEFDKAAQVYEKILNEDNSDAEAHWGLLLCKYGIEYVEDPKTYKRIPTCHRTQYESVLSDVDYLSALANSDGEAKNVYKAQAEEISELQKNILAIVKNEKPFDVFICYKETDENGKRTVDSALANDIYYQLTQEGLKVFYAAITLEDKLGQEYEPYIFAALNSAKVMLVVGTKPEYFDSVWVRNEWSRYLKLMKTDRSRLLIPCYRDMDAYDLPEEFAHLQAQDMSKIGFVNDVVRGIKKVVEQPKNKESGNETAVNSGSSGTASLLKRAFMFLEDGDWQNADEYCEKVLDIDPECAQAYLGKLMADLEVKKQEQLGNQTEEFTGNINYQKACRFADDGLKTVLDDYAKNVIYLKARRTMTEAKEESNFKTAASIFSRVKGYKDADSKKSECLEKAEACRKDAIYSKALKSMDKDTVDGYNDAISTFETIKGWKDSEEKNAQCKRRIEEIKAKEEAERLERERRIEEAKKEAERRKKLRIKIAQIATPIASVLVVFVILFNTVIVPSYKYNKAVKMIDSGNVFEAYEALVALDGYKDSDDKADSIYIKYKVEKLRSATVGDYVFFGAYEQDNNTSNGKEYIVWQVLAKEGNRILVISKYALDCKSYNTSDTDVTWKTCTLRKWLNNEFVNAAFSTNEKAMIPTVTASADKNPKYSTNPGNATPDQVFLLSITEVDKYFNSDSARQCEPTDYAVANGAWESDGGNCRWWLRSPGIFQSDAASVYSGGSVDYRGGFVNYSGGCVRPAMWIEIAE